MNQEFIRTEIDLNAYKRKTKFDIFSQKQIPIFSTTVNLDINHFKNVIEENKLKFFASICYIISEILNEIPEFKHRLIEGKLFGYQSINPGYTVLLPDNDFSFCWTKFENNFQEFHQNVLADIEKVLHHMDESNGDNNHMFYITSNHWFTFTSFTHPYDPHNGSIPIITLGKYFNENQTCKMPIALQAHHGIVDGYHFGLFFNNLQEKLNNFNPKHNQLNDSNLQTIQSGVLFQ